MAKMIQIHWNAASIDEARKVCRYLVQEKYVACANIVPWVESIFLWNDKLDVGQETKVILKTRKENFPAIKEIILQNTAFELPEILATDIADGHPEYLDWVERNSNR